MHGELVEGNVIKGVAEVAWCGGTPGKGVARLVSNHVHLEFSLPRCILFSISLLFFHEEVFLAKSLI